MANVAANVLVGKPLATGGILRGPTGTALPTDSTTAPNPALLALGYVGDDGVTQSIGADSSEIKAWGGDTVRKIQTSHDLTYQFRLIETNDGTLAVYYGENNVTTTAGATVVTVNSNELGHAVWVIEVKDGDKRVRIAIPDGQVTDKGDVVYQDSDVVAYDVTITCYPDENGNKAYIYSAAA